MRKRLKQQVSTLWDCCDKSSNRVMGYSFGTKFFKFKHSCYFEMYLFQMVAAIGILVLRTFTLPHSASRAFLMSRFGESRLGENPI